MIDQAAAPAAASVSMVYTPYHSKYWATALTLRGAGDDLSRLSQSIASARVDLNPHQVDAALAALRSPLSKGMILADEVGLGKTIEAALVIAQRWAERRRHILLILPATLRKQWQQELLEKFSLPCLILETRSYNELLKAGNPKARAAVEWCKHATEHARTLGGKPWSYVLIPHDVINASATLDGLIAAFGRTAVAEVN
jgi:adenine-specific DNA-methyltransferase